ncbi:MAG: hypothetical protein ACRDN9_15740 [Streptosporangiaceae bacterium]
MAVQGTVTAGRLARAELFTLRATPTPWALATLAVLAGCVFAAVIFAVFGITPTTDVTAFMSFGSTAGTVTLLLGVVWAAGSHRHHTIVPSVLVSPRRVPPVLAQIAALLAVGAVVGFVVEGLTFALGVVWLAGAGVSSGIPAGAVAAAWVGGIVYCAFAAALGGGLGHLTRNQVAAVIAVLLYLEMADPLIAMGVPAYGQFGPLGLGTSLTGGSASSGGPTTQLLPPAVAGVVWAGYAAVFVAAGLIATRRREFP